MGGKGRQSGIWRGRYQLLKAIEEHGSLAGAARALKMSYRAAWGRLKASEKRLGKPLVQRGGTGRRGHELTVQAHQFMELYENLQAQCEAQLKEAELAWDKEIRE
jgi:molybdate transport system regulatory protein